MISGQIKYVFFIFLSFFGASLAYAQDRLPVSYVAEAPGGLVFNTLLSYKEHSASGILVVKQMPEGFHVVLMSKMGMSILELRLTDHNAEWIKTMDWLNKGSRKRALEQDLRAVLLYPLNNPLYVKKKGENVYMVKKVIKLKVEVSPTFARIEKAQTKGFINIFKRYVVFNYIEADLVPNQLKLTHRTLKMQMDLTRLVQN